MRFGRRIGPSIQTFGPAQLMPKEVLNLNGDPLDPNDAAIGMQNRITTAVKECPGKCSDTDRLIIAALSSNYPGFNADDAAILPRGTDPITGKKNIDWGSYLSQKGDTSSDVIAQFRQWATSMNYNTQLILTIYMLDLQWFLDHGYYLPEDYDEADFTEIDEYNNEEEE